jgi:hypothetical protein
MLLKEEGEGREEGRTNASSYCRIHPSGSSRSSSYIVQSTRKRDRRTDERS